MKVYIVTSSRRIIGVYDTKEKAIKSAKESEESGYYPNIVVEGFEVR